MQRYITLLLLLITCLSAQAQDTIKRTSVRILPANRRLDTNEVVYSETGQPLRYHQYQKLLNTGEYTMTIKGSFNYANAKRYLKKLSQQEQNQTYERIKAFSVIKSPVLKEGMTLNTSPLNQVMTDSELDNKVVVLVFWSPGCPPCTESFDYINDFFKQIYNPEEVVVIAITQAGTASVEEKLKEKPLLYAKFLNNASSVYRAYQLNTYPSYVVTDKKHVIRYSITGSNQIALPMLKSSVKAVLQQ